MANIWKKAISILAGNLNLGRSYLIIYNCIIMFTFIGGAGWLQVRLPSNRKFLLNLDPCRLNRNCESRNSNEFLSDSGASKGDFISVSVLPKLFKMLRQSLKFFDSARYVLKLVHQASTPENRKPLKFV